MWKHVHNEVPVNIHNYVKTHSLKTSSPVPATLSDIRMGSKLEYLIGSNLALAIQWTGALDSFLGAFFLMFPNLIQIDLLM